MKYLKVNFLDYYSIGRTPSYAEGEKVPNGNYYFDEMRNGRIFPETPIFDYFYLKSFDDKKYWEWKLDDIHKFIGEGSQIPGWFVSEDFKLLLEQFRIPQPHHFYPSKLLYKGAKLDYYIFQFAGQNIINEIRTKYINWNKSVFFNPIYNSNLSINSMQEFIDESRNIMRTSQYKKEIILKRIALTTCLDFFPMRTFLNDDIVSDRLKQAIEDMGITGFEFTELDYEVIVE